ncbi:GIY-YIG nuclease family protein [Salinicola sp. CR57]|uniref:GIY-YIG nuclease family protein n=1 Tax=Salinicola sp. CR57 TaxID=1949086 RepID=UPI000DA1D1AD|nr:GIY-YIG nuclease family protein [Salinicola sp. CR57]
MTQTAEVYQFPNQTNPAEFFRNAGWVYVLGNSYMPEVFKIGMTTGSVQTRMAQLYTTGVPLPFDCMFAEWFADCWKAERYIHAALEDHRAESGREFFATDLRTIEHAFMAYSAIGESTPESIFDLYVMRRRNAESSETVNGDLIARNARHRKIEGAPF